MISLSFIVPSFIVPKISVVQVRQYVSISEVPSVEHSTCVPLIRNLKGHYCNLSDLLNRFSNRDIVQLSDRSENQQLRLELLKKIAFQQDVLGEECVLQIAALDAAWYLYELIWDAESVLEQHLGQFFIVPVLNPPRALTQIITDMVFHRLHLDGLIEPNHAFEKRYQHSISKLEEPQKFFDLPRRCQQQVIVHYKKRRNM